MLTKKNFPLGQKRFGALDYLISAVIFGGLAICLFFIFAAIFGFIFFKLPSPLKMTNIATLGALYISAFIASFIISKINGQKYFLCALFNSLLVASILLILSFFGESGTFSIHFLLRLICVPIIFIGAFLGIKREKTKKRRHR